MAFKQILILTFFLFIYSGFAQQNPYSKLCDCINMGPDMTVECHELKQEWKQEYEGASADRKTEMRNQFEDCRDYQKMIDSPSICTCVLINPDKWTKECIKIKKDWDKEYSKADGEQKTIMKQEILDCGEDAVEEKTEAKLIAANPVSDADFCKCTELIGQVMTLSKDGKDENAGEIYLKQNKEAFDDCKSKMVGLNIETDQFLERAMKCDALSNYFKDKNHYLYKRKESYQKIREDVCFCVTKSKEMMKEIEDAGGNESVLKDIDAKYAKTTEKCKQLTLGKSENELQKMIELAKECE